MPKISILLTDNQYCELVEHAKKEGVTITDLVISKLPISQVKKLTLKDVLNRVSNIGIGSFSIPSLYTTEEWLSYPKGSKLTVGKQFNKQVKENQIKNIKFLGKTSANLATYEKK